MHVCTDVYVRSHCLTRRRHLVDHALQFARARGPVVQIVLLRVVVLIEVELHCIEAHADRLTRSLRERLRLRQLHLVERGIHIDTNPIAKLAAEQLIHGESKRLAREIPQRRLHR
jgi:hypothetical protein